MMKTKGNSTLALAFVATIPAANWLIGNVGVACPGPCLVPVAPGLMAPSGVVLVGVALTLRDWLHDRAGGWWVAGSIAAGGLVSLLVALPALALASTVAFLASELADWGVYAPLRRRGLVLAMLASGAVGLTVDSVAFLWLAFGDLTYLPGQLVGKAWGVLAAIIARRAWIGST